MASDLEEHFLARPSTSKVGTELTKVGTELTNVSGAILLPSSIQVTESISGSVVPLAMFHFGASPLCTRLQRHCYWTNEVVF